MFKKLASDALGLSDIGQIIKPEDYDKVESDDYIMHESGEKIYFLIKSKADEYCFTNQALLHLDGDSAMSKKRMLKRFSYYDHTFYNVRLETAGTVDLDIEIKFGLGDTTFSIDVNKKQIVALKDLYKALLHIGSLQSQNNTFMDFAHKSLSVTAESVRTNLGSETALSDQFKSINEYCFNWLKNSHETYFRKDFGEVFEKFINN